MKNLYPFLNPIEWIKARKFAKQSASFDKSNYDLELYLYSKIVTNNMLHYGYFEDINTKPETISFKQFEDAQMSYAEHIVTHVKDKDNCILDVGCGMGGLSLLLTSKQLKVESLTPNKNQIEFINKNYSHLTTHCCKYEHFQSSKKFGTIINSESLQYISLIEAFKKSEDLIKSDGRWIIVDYFSIDNNGANRKPHNLNTFYEKAKEYNWSITYERDITANILPTIAYIEMYANRILLPIKHFAFEKLRYKHPKLYYLSNKLRKYIDKKIEKEARNVNTTIFKKERKYMLIVLDKNPS